MTIQSAQQLPIKIFPQRNSEPAKLSKQKILIKAIGRHLYTLTVKKEAAIIK